MRILLHNEATGMKITLKSDGPIGIQDVLDAHRILTRESHDDLVSKKEESEKQVSVLAESTIPESTRAKAVKLVGSERSLSTPLGSMADFSKYDIVYVLAKVECPVCDYEGEASTRRGNSYSKCPNCDSKLFNAFATGNPNEEDEFGYEYHATNEIVPKEKRDWRGQE